MSRSFALVGLLVTLACSPAAAQPSGPTIQIPTAPPSNPIPAPVDLNSGQLYVQIANLYDVTLSILGMPTVTKYGFDIASGTLTWNGETYQGTLRATAMGRALINTVIGSCSDVSVGTQTIYAVAHPEPTTGLFPGDTLVYGQPGLQDLVFHFFPDNPPTFEHGPGDCQGMLRFEGYGPNYNDAPYSWLPQQRDPGDFLPFNDTRWTTQNGLIAYAPDAGGQLAFTAVQEESGVVSRWWIAMSRAF